VENVLGLIGILVFIVAIIALAAGVTWVVVRFSPSPDKKKKQQASA
jgi:flagellar biogenesis protein FliO